MVQVFLRNLKMNYFDFFSLRNTLELQSQLVSKFYKSEHLTQPNKELER